MSNTVKQQEEPKPRFEIEPYTDQYGKVHEELVYMRINRPISMDKRFVDTLRAIADIHAGMSFDQLIDSALTHAIDHKVKAELMSTNRMGKFFSHTMVEKYNLPNISIDLHKP